MLGILAAVMFQSARPTLHFDRPEIQAVLGTAFDRALDNVLRINTVPFDPAHYNRTGLMRGSRFLRAGGGYEQPWTRDAAINSWNAASLFEPEVARDTLWSVTVPDERGDPIVQPDNQWWDKVIWIVGAWNHYRTTGDRAFLETAYGVATRLLHEMRRTRFNASMGLFEGPSFFNDGIAGYPSPPADPKDAGSSFVLDHTGTEHLMPLSTNCLYVGAYNAASAMAKELGKPPKEWSEGADALKSAINKRLWIPERGLYGYFLDGDGKLDPSQEGSGLAFVVLFEVANPSRARSVLKNAHVEPYGITDVYPDFPRFSPDRPGRHNAIVWPMVQGMWARAAVQMRDSSRFSDETEKLGKLAASSDRRFYEIYNAKTGKVDGGWQNGHHWGSQPDQTWSATAYLSMITNGLFGLRFEPNGLHFDPLVPRSWGEVTLEGLPYRQATLDIRLEGSGGKVKRVLVDGKEAPFMPANLAGKHSVVVILR